MNQTEMDILVKEIIENKPGCTLGHIHNMVARVFPVKGYWKQEIGFLAQRRLYVQRALKKFVNKGKSNFHAWYLE